ncbi:hypothetical protein RB195_002123 [Necator americanus]|uniref:Uncharacterized protein n=1 Tax=Necator americanus TaxID=51031 RepID=A0ABR1DHR5_NECAM
MWVASRPSTESRVDGQDKTWAAPATVMEKLDCMERKLFSRLLGYFGSESEAGASFLVNTSGATLTTGGPLTSRFRGYQGSEEGDDAETLARIKINNNLGSA